MSGDRSGAKVSFWRSICLLQARAGAQGERYAAEIERYLRGRHPEILDEFRAIISAASLERSVAASVEGVEGV